MRTYPTSPETALEDFPAVMRAHLHWQAARFRAGAGRLLIPRERQGRSLDTPHFHPVPELFFQLCGETRFTLPGRRVRVPEGALCLIPSGTPHLEHVQGVPDGFANAVLICVPPGLSLHLSLARRGEDGRAWPYGRQGWRVESDGGAELLRCLRAIEEDEAQASGAGQVRDGFVLAALGLLERVLEEAHDPVAGPPRCQRVARRILQHMGDPELTVTGLAAEVECHPDHLSREFRAAYGMTVNRYINHQRIELARHLLRRSQERVAVIARRVGYANPGYFARVFRRHTGVGPREFRLAQTG